MREDEKASFLVNEVTNLVYNNSSPSSQSNFVVRQIPHLTRFHAILLSSLRNGGMDRSVSLQIVRNEPQDKSCQLDVTFHLFIRERASLPSRRYSTKNSDESFFTRKVGNERPLHFFPLTSNHTPIKVCAYEDRKEVHIFRLPAPIKNPIPIFQHRPTIGRNKDGYFGLEVFKLKFEDEIEMNMFCTVVRDAQFVVDAYRKLENVKGHSQIEGYLRNKRKRIENENGHSNETKYYDNQVHIDKKLNDHFQNNLFDDISIDDFRLLIQGYWKGACKAKQRHAKSKRNISLTSKHPKDVKLNLPLSVTNTAMKDICGKNNFVDSSKRNEGTCSIDGSNHRVNALEVANHKEDKYKTLTKKDRSSNRYEDDLRKAEANGWVKLFITLPCEPSQPWGGTLIPVINPALHQAPSSNGTIASENSFLPKPSLLCKGLMIVTVQAGSSVEKAGLKAGDILTRINNNSFVNKNWTDSFEDFLCQITRGKCYDLYFKRRWHLQKHTGKHNNDVLIDKSQMAVTR